MEFTFTIMKYIGMGFPIFIVTLIIILLSFIKMEKLKEKLLTQGKSLTDGITNNGFQIWQTVLYIIILIAIANLFPTAWKWYWGDKTFFFMSQMCLITFILLGIIQSARKKKDRDYEMKGKGWFQFTLIVIILTAFLLRLPWDELGKSKDTGTGSYHVQTKKAADDVKSVKILAPAGKVWSDRIYVPYGYDCIVENDPAYGLDNMDIPLAMMSNDDERTIIREKVLADGSTTSVMRKDIVAKFVRVKSDGKKDAYVVARFIRKRS